MHFFCEYITYNSLKLALALVASAERSIEKQNLVKIFRLKRNEVVKLADLRSLFPVTPFNVCRDPDRSSYRSFRKCRRFPLC